MLNLFKKHTKKEIEIVAVDGKDVDKSFIDTRKEMNYSIPAYDEMIEELVNLINTNRELYAQY